MREALLPVELWHSIFEHINLSDAYQLLRVSRHFNSMIKEHTGPLLIDNVAPLRNRNWNVFIHLWLKNQTKLDLSSVDLAPHEIVRFIDEFPKIDTIIMRKLVDETVFFELLCIYAKLDPTHYQGRHLRIELGNHNKVKQVRDNRIKDFYNCIPNGNIYRHFCPARLNKISVDVFHNCHECSKQLRKYEQKLCSKCKSKCCDYCISNDICNYKLV
jgi:hypothetical protein